MPTTSNSFEVVAEAAGLGHEFSGHRRALDDVRISLRAGRVVGLLGPNGSGKSTLIRTLCRLLKPDHGQWRRPESRSALGVLVDEPALHRWLTVRQELRYWCQVKGLESSCAQVAASAVELTDRLGSRVHSLSHGMRQRLAVAIALLGDPPVIALDEPFNGLDPEQMDHLREIIRRQARRGSAVLVTTHQLAQAQLCCDDVVIMTEGTVRMSGELDELDLERLYREVVRT